MKTIEELEGEMAMVELSDRLLDLPVAETTTWLVYGASKAGKTWFAGTAGDRTLYVYFSVGEGIETLKSPGFKEAVGANPIVKVVEETDEAFAYDRACDIIDDYLKNRSDDFDTVVVDEATAFRRHAMWKGLSINKEENRSKSLDKATRRGKDSRPIFLPTMADYGTEMNLTEWFVAQYTDILKRAGKHFMILAHERNVYKKDGTGPNAQEHLYKVRPGFTGKTLPDDIVAYFDNVIHMEKAGGGEQTVHRARMQGDDVIVAGTRHAGVFKTLEKDPDFLKFIKRIKEKTNAKV